MKVKLVTGRSTLYTDAESENLDVFVSEKLRYSDLTVQYD